MGDFKSTIPASSPKGAFGGNRASFPFVHSTHSKDVNRSLRSHKDKEKITQSRATLYSAFRIPH